MAGGPKRGQKRSSCGGGCQQGLRNVETKRGRSFEVYEQFILRRRLHREVTRFSSLKNAIDVGCRRSARSLLARFQTAWAKSEILTMSNAFPLFPESGIV